MKRNLLTIILLCSVMLGFSQKDDKERLGIYKLTQLPESPLNPEFKTYKIEYTGDNLNYRDLVYSGTIFQGYEKIDKTSSDDGDLTITYEIYPFQYSEPETKTITKEKKNSDGVVTKYKVYKASGKMSYKINVFMKDKNDSVYYKKTFSDNEHSLTTNECKTYSDATKSYASIAKSTPNKIITSSANNVSSYLSNRYGYAKKSHQIHGYTVKVKKRCKFDYSDLISAFEILQKSVEIAKNDENATEQFKNEVEPAIQIWEKCLLESEVKNKKAKINKDITCAILHNIGTSYFLMKDYEKCIEVMGKCIEISKRYGNAKGISIASEKYLKREKINNTEIEM